MKERIKQFIDSKGITAGELALLLEVQRSNISHILNGRNKPGASLIEKMLIVFPELNARWLLTGEGDMTDNTVSFEPSAQQEGAKRVSSEHKHKINNFPEETQLEKIVLLYNDGTFVSYKSKSLS